MDDGGDGVRTSSLRIERERVVEVVVGPRVVSVHAKLSSDMQLPRVVDCTGNLVANITISTNICPPHSCHHLPHE
jgi:hypothetical protein